jgi:hypothetical protein
MAAGARAGWLRTGSCAANVGKERVRAEGRLAARIVYATQLVALVIPALERVLMIIDIGSVEALCPLFD